MNDVFARIWHHPDSPWYYKVASVLVVLIVCVALEAPRVKLTSPIALNQLACSDIAVDRPEGRAEQPVLTILIPAHVMARPLLSALCQEGVLTMAYSDVTVHWLPRAQLSPRMIYQQDFDVMWGRDYQLAGLSPDYSRYYDRLVALPDYEALWFAREAISAPFLATHRIGLLSDPFSRSGYQLPMQKLATLSVDVSAHIIRYSSRQALIAALINRDVDVIADTNYSPLYHRAEFHQATIAQKISAGDWFISRRVDNRQVIDVLQQYLQPGNVVPNS